MPGGMPPPAAGLFSEKEVGKVIRRILSLLAAVLMLLPAGCTANPEQDDAPALSLYAINVRKADALLLRCGNSAYLWKTVLSSLLCAGTVRRLFPSKLTIPESAVSNPAMILSVVDLPHPEGPRSVMNSLFLI